MTTSFWKQRLTFFFLVLSVWGLFVLPLTVFAQGSLVADCNPALAPTDPPGPDGRGPCNFNAFVQTLTNIINYLRLIIIPLAILFIAIGGFQMMTSAGSPEKFGSGKNMIIIAVIGIIIMLLSTLAVKAVFQFLNVDSNEVNVPTNVSGNVL